MKNLKLFIALAAAAMTFSACEDDKTPVYTEPTEFVLNTPALATQYYELASGGTIELTCSQPDYGYSAVTTYTVDVALEQPFTLSDDGTTNYVTIKAGTSAAMSISADKVAEAICKLKGITDYASYPTEGLEAMPLYIRAHASLSGVETSGIYSNTIVLQHVVCYNPFQQGGRQIYLIGAPQGWNINSDACTLNETGVGTNIYEGAFDISAGEQYFRFYTTLGDWGSDGELPSIGSHPNDGDSSEVTITSQKTEYSAVAGKGSWYTSSSWEGGFITFTVDLNDMDNIKVTMQAGNHATTGLKFIYLVGAPEGWNGPTEANAEHYASWKLYDWNGNGVYSNTFAIESGKAMFRFYTALGGWDENSLGAQAEDNPVEGEFTNNAFSGSYVEGKGSWSFPNWPGGNMTLTVDTNNKTVTFVNASE
jgi:hypothetical protein